MGKPAVPYLPQDKQFLVTRNGMHFVVSMSSSSSRQQKKQPLDKGVTCAQNAVPCKKRANALNVDAVEVEGANGGDDLWVCATTDEPGERAVAADVVDLDDGDAVYFDPACMALLCMCKRRITALWCSARPHAWPISMVKCQKGYGCRIHSCSQLDQLKRDRMIYI